MKLYYFGLYARGEPIRVLLNHAGVEYENVTLAGEAWAEFKADTTKCPFGQVPVLEKDGKFLAQGGAIVRYLGGLHGYYPEDLEQRFKVDETCDLVGDFMMPVATNHFKTKDAEEK